jgi:hypothetical protein
VCVNLFRVSAHVTVAPVACLGLLQEFMGTCLGLVTNQVNSPCAICVHLCVPFNRGGGQTATPQGTGCHANVQSVCIKIAIQLVAACVLENWRTSEVLSVLLCMQLI